MRQNIPFKMMGSPKFVIQMTLTVIGTGAFVTYLSTDAGRDDWSKVTEAEKKNPNGRQGFGYSTKKADSKKYYNEMDALRKINVQPIWEEKKTSKQE